MRHARALAIEQGYLDRKITTEMEVGDALERLR